MWNYFFVTLKKVLYYSLLMNHPEGFFTLHCCMQKKAGTTTLFYNALWFVVCGRGNDIAEVSTEVIRRSVEC